MEEGWGDREKQAKTKHPHRVPEKAGPLRHKHEVAVNFKTHCPLSDIGCSVHSSSDSRDGQGHHAQVSLPHGATKSEVTPEAPFPQSPIP